MISCGRKKKIARLAALVIVLGPLLGIGGCWAQMALETYDNPLWGLGLLSACAFIGAPAFGGILLAIIHPGWPLRLWACAPTVMNAGGLLLALYGDALDKYFRSMEGGFVERGHPRLILANVVHLLAWFVAIGVAWAAFPRTVKSPQGICRRCGYDLTGNVSGICPECGTPIDRATSSGTAHTRDHMGTPGADAVE